MVGANERASIVGRGHDPDERALRRSGEERRVEPPPAEPVADESDADRLDLDHHSPFTVPIRQAPAIVSAVLDASLRLIARSSVPRYARDHERVVSHVVRRALGDHRTRVEAVDTVAERHHHRHVVLDHEHRATECFLDVAEQGPERLRLALRDASGRFVEAEHTSVERQQAGELADASGARGQVGHEQILVAPEPHEIDELRRPLVLLALGPPCAG